MGICRYVLPVEGNQLLPLKEVVYAKCRRLAIKFLCKLINAFSTKWYQNIKMRLVTHNCFTKPINSTPNVFSGFYLRLSKGSKMIVYILSL